MTPFEHLNGGYWYGIVSMSIFLGITTVQSRLYFLNFPKDPIVTKVMVLVLLLAQVFGLGCSVVAQYRMVITHSDSAVKDSWYNAVDTVSTLVASVLVQNFFAWRISKMTKIWWAVPVVMLSLLDFGVYIRGQIHANSLELPKWDRNSVIGWAASQAATDTLISVIMIVQLRRNRTGFPRTDRAISILIRYAIHSGAATSVLAMTVLFPYIFYGMHFLHMASVAALGGVYTITLWPSKSHIRRISHTSSSLTFPHRPSACMLAVTSGNTYYQPKTLDSRFTYPKYQLG
ncbi:uncharacterized protein EI90DRAFT_1533927 [Cantharellus anzutake]|uniref:uncharacterized protein n=1 Tax=Cantharellus anzutake TaxID=1750568 RepID=UPI001903ADD9|nr:uncharacterized protein EI90DRAFT_1533927 [Cantharellus anzutake]KAF8328548.1 hypothetical protein EI90DRAFT_1533927 [Cantharellus anzutake]